MTYLINIYVHLTAHKVLHIVTATSVGLESPASRPVLIVNDCAKMTGRHSAAVHNLSQAF